MGIGSWFKRGRRSDDEETIERTEQAENETEAEQRYSSGDLASLKADRAAGGGYRGGGAMDDTDRIDTDRF
ncbi:MAG TPA: hypothetical protein VI142_01145 [Gaiellaceae bacterium]